jgi:hypothetical protein
MRAAAAIKRKEKIHYYDLQKNWTKKIVPHLKDETLNNILVRDFNKYTVNRWNKTFNRGQLPEDIESCDWRYVEGRRERGPRFWAYVKHAACAHIANFALCLASLAEPNSSWRIVTSDSHSTVWDGRKTLFEFNYQAFGIPATECWRLARYGENCEILSPSQELVLADPLPWFRDRQELPVNTPVTPDELTRRQDEFFA